MNAYTSISQAIDDPSDRANLRLRVGEHTVDFGTLRVDTRPESPRLTSKAAAVLLELARQAGATVTRDELLNAVWAGRCPTPDVLTQAIKELRRAFGDDSKPARYIETIPKIGYRLVAAVQVEESIKPSSSDVAADAAGGDGAPVDDATQRTVGRATRRHATVLRSAIAAGVAFAALALAVFIGKAIYSGPAVSKSEPRWSATGLRVLTSDPGAERRPRISPSGARLAYVRDERSGGFTHIVLRSIEPSDVTELTSPVQAHESMPAWSPDGTKIAFERSTPDSCTMFVASSGGGGEYEIGHCEDPAYDYFDWAADAKSLITTVRAGGDKDGFALGRLDLRTGVTQPLQYEHLANGQSLEPHSSPDGKWIAFRRGMAPYSDLCLMSADGGKVLQLTHLVTRFRGFTWSPDSRALIFSSNHEGQFGLYAVDIDDGEITALGVSPAQFPDAARATSTVVYEIPRELFKLTEVAIEPTAAEPIQLAPSTGSDRAPALSPNGQRMVFISNRSGSQQLWLYDFASGTAMPLTTWQNATLTAPNWRSDGQAVMSTVRRNGSTSLIEIDVASRRERVLSQPGDNVLSGTYGPTPQSYLVALGASSRLDQLVLIDSGVSGETTRRAIASGIQHAEFDPLSKQVYYTKAAERGLFRRDLAGGAEHAVSALVSSIHMDGWRVVDGRIWYLSDLAIKPAELRQFDPATGDDRLLGHLDAELRELSFAVPPSRDRIIIAPLAVDDADVGAFQLQAARKP